MYTKCKIVSSDVQSCVCTLYRRPSVKIRFLFISVDIFTLLKKTIKQMDWDKKCRILAT